MLEQGQNLNPGSLSNEAFLAASLIAKTDSSTLPSARNEVIKGLVNIDISGWNFDPAVEKLLAGESDHGIDLRQKQKYGIIVTPEQFNSIIRPQLEGKTIVATSGGFDPLQPGHSSCIIESRKHGDVVVVFVNGDWFLENKKNPKGDIGFQNLRQRCQIVSHLREVDFVIPFEIEGDLSMCQALSYIKPHVFTKGGDRAPNMDPIPEECVCATLGITVQYGTGIEKRDSSSWMTDHYFETRLGLLAKVSPTASQLKDELKDIKSALKAAKK